ncbi:MAG: glutamine--tRNA ligase/YqeY domain fusion protein [Gammaproteobacteria bacterium]
MNGTVDTAGKDFIRTIVTEDLASGKHGEVVTRFPPEPNGYLHIGHVMSICLNFGIAEEFGGRCNLRFDDTNPLKEEQDFVDSISADVRWLGFDWEDRLFYASDYFQKFYDCAVRLIEDGKAFVDGQTAAEIRESRGTLTEPGTDSPWRDRPADENLDLFARMRAGEFADGELVLRAKIDMGAPNINLRDPALFRIRKATHQRTGDAWNIYPMYDFAHPVSDALEGITHSLCTLEFEDHRPRYEWILDNLDLPSNTRQIEFSRLNVAYTITSKRKLAALIEEGFVGGWDDPRMPTVAGMRRRGYTPAALRAFVRNAGVTKKDKLIEMGALETCIREDLNERAPRAMAVLNPLKVVLLNYPEDRVERLTAANHPNRPELGSREIPFGRELYIERDDFMEDPPRKFFRLRPGGEVRLRYGYIVKCVEVVKDDAGEVSEVRCTYDPDTRSGAPAAQRKVKGTIHWVACGESVPAEVRLFDRLFTVADPGRRGGDDFHEYLNRDSLLVATDCRVEPALARADAGERFQFERQGYFIADCVDSEPGRPVFNRIVTLRDSWAKLEKAELAQLKQSAC